MGIRRHDRQDLAVLGLCVWALWALGPVLHLASHHGPHLSAASAHGHDHAHPHSHSPDGGHEHEDAPPESGHSHGLYDPGHLGVASAPAPLTQFLIASWVALREEPAAVHRAPDARRLRGPVMAQAP